ncbi:hypothetical protein DPMN_065031, partial [Dreissena polymorpha]
VLWSIAWWSIAADDPSKHPRITKTEVEYITENIKYSTDKTWTHYTLLTNIPTFMKEVLKYDRRYMIAINHNKAIHTINVNGKACEKNVNALSVITQRAHGQLGDMQIPYELLISGIIAIQ